MCVCVRRCASGPRTRVSETTQPPRAGARLPKIGHIFSENFEKNTHEHAIQKFPKKTTNTSTWTCWLFLFFPNQHVHLDMLVVFIFPNQHVHLDMLVVFIFPPPTRPLGHVGCFFCVLANLSFIAVLPRCGGQILGSTASRQGCLPVQRCVILSEIGALLCDSWGRCLYCQRQNVPDIPMPIITHLRTLLSSCVAEW